jgi:hypothetical protein
MHIHLLLLFTFALLLGSPPSLKAAPNGSEATAKNVNSGSLPFSETGTHPGNGQLWYVLNASAATQAAWYECSIQITAPASTAGYSIRIHDGFGTFDRSVIAQAGETVRALDFIAPGEGLYVTVDLNGTTATPVSFRFDAIKRTIPAEPNPRSFNNAAPFTITGTHPGEAVEQEFRYTAPVAGSYTVAAPSGWYLWDTWTAAEFPGDDRDLAMNRQPSVHTENLTAGQVFSFWLGQVDLDFNPDGVPLDYTIAVTRQAPTDLLPPVVSLTSATPASGLAPFSTTVRLRLQDDLSGIDADGTAPHSTVSLKRGATVIVSANVTTAHRVSGTALDGVYDIPLTIPAGTAAGTLDIAVNMHDLSGRSATASYPAVLTVLLPPPSNDNFANADHGRDRQRHHCGRDPGIRRTPAHLQSL